MLWGRQPVISDKTKFRNLAIQQLKIKTLLSVWVGDFFHNSSKKKNMSSGGPKQEATILEIQRLSTEDGPGIRTTVFFKGCSLNCSWCHNPESISARVEIHWIGNRCIGCETCSDVCPEKALSRSDAGVRIDRTACSGCGICVEECPAGAIERLGTSWSLTALLAEVIKDKAYFDSSGGGVTIGGGEPLLQPAFALAFLKELKKKGVQTAVDTCGLCAADALEGVMPFSDLVLFDLKQIDPVKHARLTGAGNETIVANLLRIGRSIRSGSTPTELWIRTPVIPGATDSEKNISGIGALIAGKLKGCVQRWDLLAFNNLCKDKYLRLDRKWAFETADLIGRDRMEKLAETARRSGVDPEIVHWSGITKIEN